jgi:hypothetical protein
MAEDKVELRNVNFRQLLPWTEIFRGFQVALDPKKLLLAAAGIMVMAIGWWVLSAIFFSSRTEPDWGADKRDDAAAWKAFRAERNKWNLLYAAAGDRPTPTTGKNLANDFADTPQEWELIDKLKPGQKEVDLGPNRKLIIPDQPYYKTYGTLRTWPFYEDRGPNPYLLVTGQAGQTGEEGLAHYVPWERGHFGDWVWSTEIPVLIEPLIKFLRPVIYLLKPNAGFWNRIYFTLALLWTLATWALFGGAITRMAAVQVARREKIGISEAIRFTTARYISFLAAPLFPLLFALIVTVFLIIFGFFHLIPVVGDIVVDGLGWPLVLLSGLAMAVVLVGLSGWPMMYATISTEGSDSFDALSRSYSYVYQSPWHYIWYSLVALVYGMILVFFVGFMGSLLVYLGKWGISQTPFVAHNWTQEEYSNREPEYLFIFAPTSFHWRELLVKGNDGFDSQGNPKADYELSYHWYNWAGAGLVTVWLWLVFLMVLGFGYSYFWSASTIIYLLMRSHVDDTELDEIYLEEDESEEAYTAPVPPPASTSPASAAESGLTMVEAPALKTPAPAAAAPHEAQPASTPRDGGDANAPTGSPVP